MKSLQNVFIILFLLSHFLGFSQSDLTDSPRQSPEIRVYRINSEDVRKVHLKDKDFNEEMLRAPVAMYQENAQVPILPKGNYVHVKVVNNRLNYSEYVVDNLYAKVIPSEKFVICLYDSLGNIISDATIKRGTSKLRYDKETQTYSIDKVKDEQTIEIDHKGVLHYLEVGVDNYSGYKPDIFTTSWQKIRALWYSVKKNVGYVFDPSERPDDNKFFGFVVFSKPKYKPGETVKLKGYLAKRNGKKYNGPVSLKLRDDYYFPHIDTTLITLDPYRPGMYSYEFKLTDDLNLILDKDYLISLLPLNENHSDVYGNFKYEDYELKSIRFTLSSTKEEFVLGEPVKFTAKVRDENDMAVYDGRIEVLVESANLDTDELPKGEVVFVPDTLWQHVFGADEVYETEPVVPDSIFPDNVNIKFTVKCTYLSADNEKHVEKLSLQRKANPYILDFSLDKGVLTVKELYKGESRQVAAAVDIKGENGEGIFADSVLLPYTIALPWYADYVTVATKNTIESYFPKNVKDEQMGCRFYRDNDSVYLNVDNPANIPFRYAVRKAKKEIARGYTTQLDYAAKDIGKAGYEMELTYLFGGQVKSIRASLPFEQKKISMDVTSPTTVYPGQTTEVRIVVTDKNGLPVKDADITAYSFTSKFKDYSLPFIPIWGKVNYGTPYKDSQYYAEEDYYYNARSRMDWKRWSGELALDTLEYYKFLYPNIYYEHKIQTADTTTQLLPFVVIDGEVQGVHLLWINEHLYYAKQADQQDVYSFRLKPGKYNLRFRTYDREVRVHGCYLSMGYRHIMSFDASKEYVRIQHPDLIDSPFVITSRLLKKSKQGFLSEKESAELSSQLIMVDNHFGEIELPGLYRKIDMPGYIRAGNMVYYLNHKNKQRYDRILMSEVKEPLLAGPFPEKYYKSGLPGMASVYEGDRLLVNIELEGGNRYTVYEGFQKIKGFDKSPVNRKLMRFAPNLDFNMQPLVADDIKNQTELKIAAEMQAATGIIADRKRHAGFAKGKYHLQLVLKAGNGRKTISPVLIFIEPQKEDERINYRLYYGRTREFEKLPVKDIALHLVFSDSTSYTHLLTLHEGGKNYLYLDSISTNNNKLPAQIAFKLYQRKVKSVYSKNPYVIDSQDDVINPAMNKISDGKQREGLITGVVEDGYEPIVGATVMINGTNIGAITDYDGNFEISAGDNEVLEISFVGYKTRKVKVSTGYNGRIVLEASEQALHNEVLNEYEAIPYRALGSVLTGASMQMSGQLFGIVVNAKEREPKPLLIVNGMPFTGNLSSIDPAVIRSMTVLKGDAAAAIYGARAADGVVVIETTAFGSLLHGTTAVETLSEESGNVMRRNFRDDAFWQPRLRTDEKGEAHFEVTYPDDITSWKAYFIALGDKKQSDVKQLDIQSFKSLSAHLSVPRFAVRGDSLNAVGKIVNHLGDSVQMSRTIVSNEEEQVKNIVVSNSYVELIPVNACVGDSLKTAYSLLMKNGYFDGEERSVPILEPGMMQTKGNFRVLNDTTVHRFSVYPDLGEVTIHAECSALEMFMREFERIERYPYMCNEQIASKLKALLAKKTLLKIQGKKFEEDKAIKKLVNELMKNQNMEGLWGWWYESATSEWISKHVLDALLDAEEEGYVIKWDKMKLIAGLEQKVKNSISNLPAAVDKDLPFAKGELLDRLILLKRLGASIDYRAYLAAINSRFKSKTVKDRLKSFRLESLIGFKDLIRIDSLMYGSAKTLLGSLYWSEVNATDNEGCCFRRPYDTNIEHTLLAYKILKTIGGYEKELEAIRSFFFEQRRDQSWRNIYESSRIVQCIMPDVLNGTEVSSDAVLYVDGNVVADFPYTGKKEPVGEILVRKTGAMPVFVTTYQNAWNNKPSRECSNGLKVSGWFEANEDTVAVLSEGRPVVLVVNLTLDGEAEYVQIEVPIPAGCTYDSKPQKGGGKETHREYYKEKTVIFCNKLAKGEHSFRIELLPKYTGRYTLNPAKAELMYFPTVYGNEEVKTTRIQ